MDIDLKDFVTIPNYENYVINKQGIVYSLPRFIFRPSKNSFTSKLRIKNPYLTDKGYLTYELGSIMTNGKVHRGKRMFQHRLLAMIFIPNPENKPEVNHIDGNKLNNSLENLEWSTKLENMRHAQRIDINKAMRSGEQHEMSKMVILTKNNEEISIKGINETCKRLKIDHKTLENAYAKNIEVKGYFVKYMDTKSKNALRQPI